MIVMGHVGTDDSYFLAIDEILMQDIMDKPFDLIYI